MSTVAIPGSIDATGTTDVSSALATFITSQAAGTVICFGGSTKTYRVDTAIKLGGLTNITLDGRTTGATGGSATITAAHAAGYNENYSCFYFQTFPGTNSGVTVHDFVLIGSSPTPGVYIGGEEGQMGILCDGGTGFDLYNLTISAVYGDGVEFNSGCTLSKVHDSTITTPGRIGVTVIWGNNIEIGPNINITHPGYMPFDIEPNTAGQDCYSINIHNNTTAYWSNAWMAINGSETTSAFHDITIQNNVSTGYSLYTIVNPTGAVRMSNIIFSGNSSDTTHSGPVFTFTDVDGLTVQHNTQAFSSGSLISDPGCTSTTITPNNDTGATAHAGLATVSAVAHDLAPTGVGFTSTTSPVNSADGSSASTTSLVVTITAPTAGNTLIAVAGNNAGTAAIASGQGGVTNWNHVVAAGYYEALDVWYGLVDTTPTTSVTITLTSGRIVAKVMEWSGLLTLDTSRGASGSSTTMDPSAILPSFANELVLGVGLAFQTVSAGPTGGFTDMGTVTSSTLSLGVAALLETTPASADTTWIITTGGWDAAILCWQVAGGGAVAHAGLASVTASASGPSTTSSGLALTLKINGTDQLAYVDAASITISNTANRQTGVMSFDMNGAPGSYRQAVLATSPVSYWRLGESSGLVAVDVMGANNGTYFASPTLGVAGLLTGDPDTAVTLNGTTQYMTVPATTVGDVFTLGIWLSRARTLTQERVWSAGPTGYDVFFSGGVDTPSLSKHGTGTIVTATHSIVADGRHFLVISKNGSDVHIYIDGVDYTGAVSNQTIANTGGATNIGRRSTAADYFDGTMDEPAIWNRVLSPTEVATLYAAGLAGTLTPPVEEQTVIFADSTRYYAGLIRNLVRTETIPNKGGWISYHVDCQDLTTLLDDNVVTEIGVTGRSVRSVVESDKARITWLLTTYGTKGVTAGSEVQTLTAKLPSMDFTGMTLTQAIAMCLATSGANSYVDYFYRLHTFLTESYAAPFALSDTPNNTTTFGYTNLNMPTETTGLTNAIYLVPGLTAKTATDRAFSKWYTDATSIATYGRRETALSVPTILTYTALDALGAAMLAANAYPLATGSLTTYKAGLSAGMITQITNADYALSSKNVRITQVDTTFPSKNLPTYQVWFGDYTFKKMTIPTPGVGSRGQINIASLASGLIGTAATLDTNLQSSPVSILAGQIAAGLPSATLNGGTIGLLSSGDGVVPSPTNDPSDWTITLANCTGTGVSDASWPGGYYVEAAPTAGFGQMDMTSSLFPVTPLAQLNLTATLAWILGGSATMATKQWIQFYEADGQTMVGAAIGISSVASSISNTIAYPYSVGPIGVPAGARFATYTFSIEESAAHSASTRFRFGGASVRPISIGTQPTAYPDGAGPFLAWSSSGNQAVNQSLGVPITIHAPQVTTHCSIYNTDTTFSRSFEWRLFYDPGGGSTTVMTEVVGMNGSVAWTAGAAGIVSSSATAGGVLQPGCYWLVIRNNHATNTLGLAHQASAFGTNFWGFAKSTTGALGSTFDMSTITAQTQTALAIWLSGETLGKFWG